MKMLEDRLPSEISFWEPKMSTEEFFVESTDQSQVKSAIVAKYFQAWSNVVIQTAKKGSRRIAYIDLFAGPGRYADGTKSTPLLVLEQAIARQELQEMLVSIFNDKDEKNVRELEAAINSLPDIQKLKHKPQVRHQEVGENIVKMFEEMRFIPSLLFVDPWGYKGLSLRLVNSVLKNWGCDCIFFFNYNRINMGLGNEQVKEHMDALFGEIEAEQLRLELEELDPGNRELLIIEKLSQALIDLGGRFVLPFCFKNDRGNRTSHHLIFVSKSFRGYDIMKGIMAKESSSADQGVPSFEYNPADERYPMLFELTRPMDDLSGLLLEGFSGRVLSVKRIYEEHSVGRSYVLRNYKAALISMEAEGKVKAEPPFEKRPKRKGEVTMADHIRVTFPPTEAP